MVYVSVHKFLCITAKDSEVLHTILHVYRQAHKPFSLPSDLFSSSEPCCTEVALLLELLLLGHTLFVLGLQCCNALLHLPQPSLGLVEQTQGLIQRVLGLCEGSLGGRGGSHNASWQLGLLPLGLYHLGFTISHAVYDVHTHTHIHNLQKFLNCPKVITNNYWLQLLPAYIV